MHNTINPIELETGINLLRSDSKVLKLPCLDILGRFLEDGERIELVLLDTNNYSVESVEGPIKFGKFYGNRVFLNSMFDEYNINPSFIWDAKKRQWHLCNAGYVCFSEQEIEYKKCHQLWGERCVR